MPSAIRVKKMMTSGVCEDVRGVELRMSCEVREVFEPRRLSVVYVCLFAFVGDVGA